jgi:GT2 family glycosyltransferase
MIETPLVSIIIINYNGLDLLKKCLPSLSKIQFINYEIILVDNNSDDQSINFVTKNFPKIILIKLEKNKGFAEPNNIGSKIAKGKYILFLNNDTIVTKNFLTELLNSISKDEQIGICQSMLLKLDNTIDSSGDFIDELGIVFNSKTPVKTEREISSARGASMLVRKDVFDKLKGFDEKFFVSFEDVDLGWRAWINGFKVVLSPKSIVYHMGGQTVDKIKRDVAFHGFKNQLSMKITNFEIRLSFQKLIKFFIVYGIKELRIWFDYLIKGNTSRTATKYETNQAQKPSFQLILKSILWLISNVGYLHKKQKFVNSNRIMSTKSLQKRNILTKKYQ